MPNAECAQTQVENVGHEVYLKRSSNLIRATINTNIVSPAYTTPDQCLEREAVSQCRTCVKLTLQTATNEHVTSNPESQGHLWLAEGDLPTHSPPLLRWQITLFWPFSLWWSPNPSACPVLFGYQTRAVQRSEWSPPLVMWYIPQRIMWPLWGRGANR